MILSLKNNLSYKTELGSDPSGNITRIDNVLNGIETRLSSVENNLEDTKKNYESAKKEIEKPFPQEEELKTKSKRLDELNIKLNLNNKDKEIIVLTDLFGGSVNNEFLQYINQDHVYLVAGLNLPLLIELVSRLDAEVQTTVLIQQVLTDSKKMIQFCNERINQEIEEDEF